jgi:hypothetical protein
LCRFAGALRFQAVWKNLHQQRGRGPLWAMAEMIADFIMEAEVTHKVGAEPHKTQ